MGLQLAGFMLRGYIVWLGIKPATFNQDVYNSLDGHIDAAKHWWWSFGGPLHGGDGKNAGERRPLLMVFGESHR